MTAFILCAIPWVGCRPIPISDEQARTRQIKQSIKVKPVVTISQVKDR